MATEKDGTYSLRADVSPDQKGRLESWTATRVGTKVEVRVDGTTVIAPLLREPVREGKIVITDSDDDRTSLRLLTVFLQTGPLEQPLARMPSD
jgi:hypothetical protein